MKKQAPESAHERFERLKTAENVQRALHGEVSIRDLDAYAAERQAALLEFGQAKQADLEVLWRAVRAYFAVDLPQDMVEVHELPRGQSCNGRTCNPT